MRVLHGLGLGLGMESLWLFLRSRRRSGSSLLVLRLCDSRSRLGSVVSSHLSRLHSLHSSHVSRDGIAQATILITLAGTSRRKERKATSERVPVRLRERWRGGSTDGEDRQRKIRGMHGGLGACLWAEKESMGSAEKFRWRPGIRDA